MRMLVKSSGAILAFVSAIAIVSPAIASGTTLTLINGWQKYSNAAPEPTAYLVNGIVHLKGAMKTANTNPVPFVLPAPFRPASNVYLKVSLCNSNNGRLLIDNNGGSTVSAENGTVANWQCLTSLDGVSYAVSSDLFKPLTLRNQWTTTSLGTAAPAVRLFGGVVHFEGAMQSSGTNGAAFMLPAKFRPATTAYVPVDMNNSTNGRLIINPDGTMSVQAENDPANASAFTSLDGAEFALNEDGFTPLTLIHGWTNYDVRTAAPGVRLLNGGIVQFRGAMANGVDALAFVLPAQFRPKKLVRVPTDLFLARNGSLVIGTNGSVTVKAEVNFSDAQGFTSLDGASFHL